MKISKRIPQAIKAAIEIGTMILPQKKLYTGALLGMKGMRAMSEEYKEYKQTKQRIKELETALEDWLTCADEPEEWARCRAKAKELLNHNSV